MTNQNKINSIMDTMDEFQKKLLSLPYGMLVGKADIT